MATLEDDWDKLSDDDDYSVISAPASEPDLSVVASSGNIVSSQTQNETLNCLPVQEAPATIPEPSGAQSTATECGKPEDGYREEQNSPEEHGAQLAKPIDKTTPSNADDLARQATSPSYYTDDLSKLEGYLDELSKLDGVIKETLECTERSALKLDMSARARMICTLLAQQLNELRTIIAGYGKVWDETFQEVPIDPSLDTWVIEVMAKLLAVQDELKLHTPDVTRYNGCCSGLIKDHEQMQEFLPIMQGDYNDFQTQHTSTEPARPGTHTTVPPIPIRNTSTSARPGHEAIQFRRELYNLNDEIQRSIEELSTCVSLLPPSSAALATEIVQTFGCLFNTLSMLLSNHGSERIEHGISGRLTYAEFTDWDAEAVRDFALELAQIWDTLDVRHSPDGARWSSMMVDCHKRHMLLEQGMLEKLETVGEVLREAMTPHRHDRA